MLTLESRFEVSAVLQCFEEMSSKICLRDRDADAVLKRTISGSQAIDTDRSARAKEERICSGADLLFVRIDLAFILYDVDLIQFFYDLSKRNAYSYQK